MHRSRLAGLIIDCQAPDLAQSAAFWAEALGYPIRPAAGPAGRNYAVLDTRPEDPHIEVQRVEHPSRVHLDIETDDLEAEVRRLEALGAKRVAQIERWWVMEAPTGQRFCVVPAERAGFEENANRWD